MELKQYINLLRRWVWLIILGMLIGAAGGYYFSSLQTPIYQAESRFMILRAAPTSIDYYYYYEDNQEMISTYIQLLSTDSLLNRASEKLGFTVNKGQATAAQIGDTQFATLAVKDENPQRAFLIADILIETLIQTNEELQSIRYLTAEQNLQNRITEAENQISLLQDQLNSISSTAVAQQINEVQTQIDLLQTRISGLEKRNAELNQYETLSTGQRSEFDNNQEELDQKKPILALYQQIYTNLVVLGKPVENNEQSNVQINQLETTLSLYQNIYVASVSDMEALRLTRAQSTPSVVQVEPAKLPKDPVSPKPVQTALLAGVVGLILTAGIAFLIEYLDDSLKTPEEVTKILGLPVIGLIGNMQSGRKSKKGIVEQTGAFVSDNPRSPISEAFRTLRTNLEFASIDKPLRSIIVISANPSEGKTTVSSNLAIILSQNEKRVLLVDADMRRPKIHKQLELPNRIGLSDLIRSRAEIEDVVQSYRNIRGFNVITSGALPPNPAELLGSNRMQQLINEFIKRYDIVVIDSPPMMVSDSIILSNLVDGVIFTVQPGSSKISPLLTSINELRRLDVKLLGVVMNRIPRNRDYYYSGYRYYSSSKDKSGGQYYSNLEQ